LEMDHLIFYFKQLHIILVFQQVRLDSVTVMSVISTQL